MNELQAASVALFFILNTSMTVIRVSASDHVTMMFTNTDTSLNTSPLVILRSKRQYLSTCPAGCFPSCYSSSQCQQVAPRTICIQACCCPAAAPPRGQSIFSPGSINIIPIPVPVGSPTPLNTFSFSTACDGGPAIAACINGLCGQGFFCNNRGFCCRCATGNSSGPCVNNLCPAGFSCNTNNFCCPLGSGSVLGPCINNQCPAGFVCGAGNLCYSVAVNGRKKRK